jgi:hypothetical protein
MINSIEKKNTTPGQLASGFFVTRESFPLCVPCYSLLPAGVKEEVQGVQGVQGVQKVQKVQRVSGVRV